MCALCVYVYARIHEYVCVFKCPLLYWCNSAVFFNHFGTFLFSHILNYFFSLFSIHPNRSFPSLTPPSPPPAKEGAFHTEKGAWITATRVMFPPGPELWTPALHLLPPGLPSPRVLGTFKSTPAICKSWAQGTYFSRQSLTKPRTPQFNEAGI